MNFRFYIVVVGLSLMNLSGFTQEQDSESVFVNEVFTLVYNQQFDEAERLLASKKSTLDEFYFMVLNIDLHWWKYSTSRSKDDAQRLNQLLKSSDKILEPSTRGKISLLVKKSYQLRYERKRYNIFGIISLRSEINSLLEELYKEELPLSAGGVQLFDLYIAMFRYFEEVNPLFLQRHSQEQLKNLQAMENFALQDDLIISTMAHYFLGRIYQKIEREPQKANHHFQIIALKFPHNSLIKEHIADCTKKL